MNRIRNHRSELDLAALLDGELGAEDQAAARRHLTRCLECSRRFGALRHENRLLVASLAPGEAEGREVRREFGWVVAAGLALSGGLLVFRRLLAGSEGGIDPPAVPEELLTRLVYALLSLFDFAAILTRPLIGGILIMTLLAAVFATVAARRLRPGAMSWLFAAALLPAFATAPAPAEAFEVRSGTDAECRVEQGEVVDDDLILLCQNARIAGEVRGDVYYLAQSLTLTGQVDGDLIGLSERLDIEGNVGLSWRGAAQTGRILGQIGHSVTGAGQLLEVREQARIGGAAVLAGEHLLISGPITRSLVAAGRRVDLDGTVGGDLRVSADELDVGSGVTIGGTARYEGEAEPVRAAGAPEVEWTPPEAEERRHAEAALDLLTSLARALLFGGLLVLVASRPLSEIAAVGGRPLGPVLVGLLLFVGLPFAVLLAALTFIGLPLALATAGLYLFLLYASGVVAALVIGQAILGLAETRWQRFVRLTLGLAVLAVVVEIPMVGWVLSLLIMFFGLGAFGLWVWRSRSTALAASG